VPRVALLALTVLAVMANISQRSSPDGTAGSRVTIALSGILFVGVLLLLVALPAAFFRAKIQEARERHKSRKVRMQTSRNRTICVCRNSELSERSSSPTAACEFSHPNQHAALKTGGGDSNEEPVDCEGARNAAPGPSKHVCRRSQRRFRRGHNGGLLNYQVRIYSVATVSEGGSDPACRKCSTSAATVSGCHGAVDLHAACHAGCCACALWPSTRRLA
jgi:hypothetical protein